MLCEYLLYRCTICSNVVVILHESRKNSDKKSISHLIEDKTKYDLDSAYKQSDCKCSLSQKCEVDSKKCCTFSFGGTTIETNEGKEINFI